MYQGTFLTIIRIHNTYFHCNSCPYFVRILNPGRTDLDKLKRFNFLQEE